MEGLEPAALRDEDPAVRAAALGRIRYRDLKDPRVLGLVLAACRDGTPIPMGSADRSDPTGPAASFFADELGAGRTVADVAFERVQKAGIPGDSATVSALAGALGEPGNPGRLPSLVAGLLGETRWAEPEAALRSLIAALDHHDIPLFAAIVALPSSATPWLVDLALSPFRPRLFQELLNHPPSREALVRGAVRAFEDQAAGDPGTLATVTTVLAAWNDPAAATIARAQEDRFPWLVAVRALEQPEARAPLAAWLASPGGVPSGWWRRVTEILCQREPVPDFPVAAWLRAAGQDHGLCAAWGVDAPGVVEVLQSWVRSGGPRAATSARLLWAVNAHGPVLTTIDSRWVVWDAGDLSAAAAAEPALPALLSTILDRLREDPSAVRPAVAAIRALGGAWEAAEIVLARAEAVPERTARTGRGLVRVFREGVDLEAVEPLLEGLVVPDLRERFEAVRPFVRAATPADTE